jgi:hypothetical protein
MSIYEEEKTFPKFSFAYSKLKFPFLLILLVLLAAFLLVFIFSLFKPDPLLVSFEEKEFNLKEKKSLLMKVVVFNLLEKDVVNSVLTVKPVDEDSLSVFPDEVIIPVLGKGESRSFNFNLRAREDIPSGNYEIEITLLSGGRKFVKRSSIYVKAQ